MQLYITPYVKMDTPPPVTKPVASFYEQMGEENMRKMVDTHYNLLVDSEVKDLFPPKGQALEAAKKHSADFIIQICGGPAYYNQNRGKPLLKKRHMPFKISPRTREVWLMCYEKALEQFNLPEKELLSFWQYLDTFSLWMINAQEEI